MDAGELVECLPTTHQTLCSSPVANNYHPRTLQVETEGSEGSKDILWDIENPGTCETLSTATTTSASNLL